MKKIAFIIFDTLWCVVHNGMILYSSPEKSGAQKELDNFVKEMDEYAFLVEVKVEAVYSE